jgi:ankyrin repeat protein
VKAASGLLSLVAAALVLSCNAAENGERGGALEQQLEAATVAADAVKVEQLLASGANPNKMVPHEGHLQSPWKLALHQVRPQRSELVEIVRAMLQGHANPEVAWGEAPSRRGGTGYYTTQPETPLLEALSTEVPDVVRALMAAGLDPRHGQIALVLAVENRQTEIVHILVEAGVDVNCHPSANTPLVAAIEARDVALMTFLEEHGARERP